MAVSDRMKILIAGGGIAGLTAALCLAQDGHRVSIFEQASELSEVGAGLQISPNGMHVLNALGLGEAVVSAGFEPEEIELRFGKSGQVIFNVPLADQSVERWGAPYIHIHRADLLDVLIAAASDCENITIRTGFPVRRLTRSDDAVTVHSDSEAVSGDLLIGADGIHSVVREALLGPDTPRFTGCVAWRGVIETAKLGSLRPPPTACAWVGQGAHMVSYYLRGGALVNLVGVVERDAWRTESWTEGGSKAAFLKDFEGWDPTLINLIENGDRFFRWALFDRNPLSHWVDDRVALMGDACHPMLPFVAQGAVMAIEDAYVLARSLREASDIAEGLQSYQAARHARTARVQAQSRQNAQTFHHRNPLKRLTTYGPMWLAGHAMPEVVHKRLDWIYGHDVTA